MVFSRGEHGHGIHAIIAGRAILRRSGKQGAFQTNAEARKPVREDFSASSKTGVRVPIRFCQAHSLPRIPRQLLILTPSQPNFLMRLRTGEGGGIHHGQTRDQELGFECLCRPGPVFAQALLILALHPASPESMCAWINYRALNRHRWPLRQRGVPAQQVRVVIGGALFDHFCKIDADDGGDVGDAEAVAGDEVAVF